MELLIDTNVILDMVLNRKDAKLSAKLFKIIVSNKYHAYINGQCSTKILHHFILSFAMQKGMIFLCLNVIRYFSHLCNL